MSSRAHRPPPTTTTATASARRESRLYDPQQAYYTDSQQQAPSSSRKPAKLSKQRDHHPPPAASSSYHNKGGYYASYGQPTTAGAGIARPQSVAPSISSHRDYPAPPPARAPSVQPSLSHYTSHAQLPPARPPSTQPQQIARPPSRAGHGVAPSISQGHSQSQAQAWAAYHAAAGTVPSSSYGAAAPGSSAPSASQAPPPPSSTARMPSTSANAYPSLFEGYGNGIDGYATSSYNNPPSTSYGHPYQNMTIPGKARSSRHRDLEKEYDPSPQSSNERVVWQRDAANAASAAVDDQREGRSAPPPTAPIAVPGVAGTAKSSRHREREYGVPIAPSTSYKQSQYEIPGYAGSGYVIPPQGIAVAKSSRSVREKERDVVPAGVAVATSTTRRRDKERDRGERTDAEDERREERRRNRDVEDDRRRRDRERGGDKTDAEDDRRRADRRRERDRGEKTDAEDDRRREERRRERERERERAARERDRDTDAEDAYRRRKERDREERRRDRERRAQTDAEDDTATTRRREERRRERDEEKRRDEEKKRERERERQEREREEERRREERERIRQERIRIEAEERERRRRIQAEADYRAQVEAQAAATAAARAQAEGEERQRRLQAEAHARAEAEERERQRAAHQAELEERERQRLALIEQERRAAKAEAEERQRRMQAETEERHRRMQAETAAAKALAETQAREAEEQRRLQAETQARHQAEARSQAEAEAARARAEADAQAAQAREQERQRRLQAEADDKERHRLAFLEQQRQVSVAKAEAEERQRRLQAEAAAKAQSDAQEREREKQRRLQAQAEAEARERDRQAAAIAKAEAEDRQRRRQEEAEERERQRRIQTEHQARAEAEERQKRRQEEAEERERQRRIQAENQAKAEADERQRRRQEEAEERERQRRIQADNQARAEAEERQRRRQEEAEERERQRRIQAENQAKAEAEERQRRRQEEAEERERQRRIQAENQAKAEAEERERQRRLQAEAQAKAEAEERERQRQAYARAQAEAEERERYRLAALEHERKAEEHRRRLQAEAEELERQHQYQLRLAAEAQEREHQRRLQAEAEEKERQRRQQAEEQERERRRYQAEQEERQRRYQAEVEEKERQRRYQAEVEEKERQRRHQAETEEKERQRRLQAEAEEKERQRRLQAEAEEKERQRRLQAEADEKERHRLAFLEQQRQVALAKAEAEERQRRLREEAEAKERERMRQAADERQRRLQAEAEEKERERQKARAEAQARADAEEEERQRRLQAEADEREKQRASAEEWARKEKERSAANAKPSNDLLWGPPPVPAKNPPPATQPTSTSTSSNQPSSVPVIGHRHTASVPIATNSLHMHPQLQQQPQDSPPMRVLGDSNRERGSDNSPRNRKRDSQLLHPNIPVVEKTGSGRYREKSSRPTAIPTLPSHSNHSQSSNATSQIPPSSAPAQMQEFGVNPPALSSRDITPNDSVMDRDGTRDKRRASRLPENQPQPQLSHQASKQPEAEPTNTAARLAALMTHTDSNLPYFQRKPSKDSLVVNPNTSGFLTSLTDFSRNRRPSNEPSPIPEVDNPASQYSRPPISAPAAISTTAQGSPLHKQPDSQPGYLQQQRTYDRQPSSNATPVLPLHPQELIDSTNQQVPRSSTEVHGLTRVYGDPVATQVERERHESTKGDQPEIGKDHRKEPEREVEQVVQNLTQGKTKKGKKETKKEKAKAKEEKKKEKEREKENLAQQRFALPQEAEEEANGNSTIKAKSTSKHKGLPEIWTLGRASQEGRRTSPSPNEHDGANLPSSQDPISQNSTVKLSKKERRQRRHISFGQGQDKAGQESSSEHEMATGGTWGKGSLRGFFKNSERNQVEDNQVSSTDTDQDPEAAKRHKRRTSSRIHEGFSAAVEASAKLASLLVPGRGNRSRKSSHHSIMATHEASVDQDQQTAARFSTDEIADNPAEQHQRKLSEDTNTIPFPQPTVIGKGPIVSAPITTPLGDGPELIVPRSPYRRAVNLPPSQHVTGTGFKQNPSPSVSHTEQDPNRTRDAQRLAALINVPILSSESRSRSDSLVPAPGQVETLPAASLYDSAAPQNKNVAQQLVHHEERRPSLDRPSAPTHLPPHVAYHGNARLPALAPQAPERPALATSVSYSSTAAEASSRNGSSLMPSNSSSTASTILPNSLTTQALPVAETKNSMNPQSRPPVNNGDTSMIAQLLSRPSAPKDHNPPAIMSQSQPSNPMREAGPIAMMDASTKIKDAEKPPVDVLMTTGPAEPTPYSNSTVPPHIYTSQQGTNAHGSKERIPKIDQPTEPRNAELPQATSTSVWTKPPPVPGSSYHTSSYDADGARAQAPQASTSNATPQQPAVLRTKDSSHSRQNSQDTLVDMGLKSSPHDRPSAIVSAAKGSPLAKRNDSQDMVATKESSQQSLINPTTAIAAPNVEQPSSRTDTNSKMPNLLSGYPESRSRPIPNNTQPVSLLPATAPTNVEPISKPVTSTPNTNSRPRPPPPAPDSELPPPIASTYSTRPPNLPPPTQHTNIILQPPEKALTAAIPVTTTAPSSKPPNFDPTSRPQDDRAPAIPPNPSTLPPLPAKPTPAPPPRVHDPAPPSTSHPRPSERPSYTPSRSVSQPVPSTTTAPALTSRSQEEVAAPVISPVPVSAPPTRSAQPTAPAPGVDRKAAGTPYPVTRSATDPDVELPAPAAKSKAERSPPTQLRQHLDPVQDSKPDPPQPTEPTTRRVRPIRGIADQGPHRLAGSGQTITVQVTPEASRRERVRTTKDRETTRKRGLFGIFRSREAPAQQTVATAEKPMTDSNESLPDSMPRLRPVESAPAAMTPLIPVATVISKIEDKRELEIVSPIPVHGNGKALSKRHAPFRVTAKRYRTVSQASMDAADGNTVSMIMSGADSIRSSTAGRPSPPLRDPIMAAMEWRNKEEAAHQDRGKRRRRPGVVFDVEDEQTEKEKTPAKVVRRGTRGRLTKPPPDSTGRGD